MASEVSSFECKRVVPVSYETAQSLGVEVEVARAWVSKSNMLSLDGLIGALQEWQKGTLKLILARGEWIEITKPVEDTNNA